MQEIAQLWTDATGLSTAHIADGCVRAGLQVRCGPAVSDRAPRLAGRCLPVRHFGSVDVFLEAIERSHPGDVLIVDNQGRTDESCVGDLVALEAKAAGLSGIAIWGLHRDTRDLRDIGLPVFSLGALPAGRSASTSDAAIPSRLRSSASTPSARAIPSSATRTD